MNDNLTPKAIVAALDEHIVGQADAKRAVAVALRNRWRRQRLSPELRDEVTPKNILMIGPDRLRQDRDQPPAGQAGRSAVRQGGGDQVHRGRLCRPRRRADRPRPGRRSDPPGKGPPPRSPCARRPARRRWTGCSKRWSGEGACEATRESFRQRIVENAMNEVEVEIEVEDAPRMPMDIPGMGGGVGMINLSDMMGKAFGRAATSSGASSRCPMPGTSWSTRKPKSAWTRTMSPAWRWPMPRPTASCSWTRSTRSRSPTCAADRSAAKACSAICCR